MVTKDIRQRGSHGGGGGNGGGGALLRATLSQRHSFSRRPSLHKGPLLHPSQAISKREHFLIVLGLGLGTLLEWYDLQLYSGLSNTISNNFFPKGNAVAQALSFWGIFALAFITRPIGAIIFGHVGDRVGRRLSLLISIAAMALPTILIGCIPSYKTIGLAAPAILAALRLIQGLSVGGEFGTAVVYASELAPPGWEARHGCFIVSFSQVVRTVVFLPLTGGLVVGEVAIMIVVAACSAQQLEVWGWRIPFVLNIFTAALALLLRMNFPEPLDLIARAQLDSGAAPECGLGPAGSAQVAAAAIASDVNENEAAVAAAAAAARKGGDVALQGGAAAGEAARNEAAAELAARMRHRVPIGVLLRHHFLALVLHAFVVCYAQASISVVSTWLPKHLRDKGVNNLTTQIMYLTALPFKIAAVLATGYAADKGMPICYAGAINALVGIAVNFGTADVVHRFTSTSASNRGLLAGTWFLQAALLCLSAMALGLLPTVGTKLYPASVRASGYNLGYSVPNALVGGLTPFAVTAIRATGSQVTDVFGAALWTLAAGMVTALSYLAMARFFPETQHPKLDFAQLDPDLEPPRPPTKENGGRQEAC